MKHSLDSNERMNTFDNLIRFIYKWHLLENTTMILLLHNDISNTNIRLRKDNNGSREENILAKTFVFQKSRH